MPAHLLSVACALLALASAPAAAQIVLDRLIVELGPEAGASADIEVRNQGDETAYIQVDAAEIVEPGTPAESRRRTADPEALGLLAAPSRLVLEPGARRIVRLSRLARADARERIWRVGVRPVTGETTGETNALKVLVGYGVLVVGRPDDAHAELKATRAGGTLELVNTGNSNALLFDGQQCDGAGGRCIELPTRRLYPDNRWRLELRWDTPVIMQVDGPDGVAERRF